MMLADAVQAVLTLVMIGEGVRKQKFAAVIDQRCQKWNDVPRLKKN